MKICGRVTASIAQLVLTAIVSSSKYCLSLLYGMYAAIGYCVIVSVIIDSNNCSCWKNASAAVSIRSSYVMMAMIEIRSSGCLYFWIVL